LTRRIAACVMALVFLASKASADVFANPAAITVSNPASSAGSQILVSGLGSSTTSLDVQVSGLSHNHVGNLALVVVAPTGSALVLLGGTGPSSSLLGSTSLVFSDTASGTIPLNTFISPGTFKPTQYAAIGSFPPPGPGAAYQSPQPWGTSTLTTTVRLGNPNGIWSLYAFDPVSGDSGQISGGWGLQITGTPRPIPALPQSATWILGALLGVTALRGTRST